MGEKVREEVEPKKNVVQVQKINDGFYTHYTKEEFYKYLKGLENAGYVLRVDEWTLLDKKHAGEK